jgi:hypothetical protein
MTNSNMYVTVAIFFLMAVVHLLLVRYNAIPELLLNKLKNKLV